MIKTLEELASLVNGELVGENIDILGISGISYARKGYLTFIENKKHIEAAKNSHACAVITPHDVDDFGKPLIKVKNPRLAFARILSVFNEARRITAGIHQKAVLGENVKLGEGVYIGPYAVLGNNVKLGDNVKVFPFAYIDDGVELGDDTVIYPHVSVMMKCVIGKRVVIHSGTIIGADGFGYVRDGKINYKIPQVGNVVIGDDVEIGANVTIDRATTESTVIGRGTKIDNIIQVGHNTKVGEDCILVSQSGIAGSVIIGDRVTIASQAGIRDHVEIGSDTIVAGRGGVTKDIPARSLVSGYPARDHREELRIEAGIAKLPELIKRVAHIEKKLGEFLPEKEV